MPDRPDLTPIDIHHPDSAGKVLDALGRVGLAIVSGADDRAAVVAFGSRVMRIRPHRDSEPDGVTVIERRVINPLVASVGGFTDAELAPHTDGSAVAAPPDLMMTVCVRRPDTGGSVVLVDGRRVHADVTADPEMLTALTAPRSAYFGGASGYLGSIFQDLPDGRTAIRIRLDDRIQLSPTAAIYLPRLREIVDSHAITVDLDTGHGYVLRNDWWLHGRTHYIGERRMLRLIGDHDPSHDAVRGFLSLDALADAHAV